MITKAILITEVAKLLGSTEFTIKCEVANIPNINLDLPLSVAANELANNIQAMRNNEASLDL